MKRKKILSTILLSLTLFCCAACSVPGGSTSDNSAEDDHVSASDECPDGNCPDKPSDECPDGNCPDKPSDDCPDGNCPKTKEDAQRPKKLPKTTEDPLPKLPPKRLRPHPPIRPVPPVIKPTL